MRVWLWGAGGMLTRGGEGASTRGPHNANTYLMDGGHGACRRGMGAWGAHFRLTLIHVIQQPSERGGCRGACRGGVRRGSPGRHVTRSPDANHSVAPAPRVQAAAGRQHLQAAARPHRGALREAAGNPKGRFGKTLSH